MELEGDSPAPRPPGRPEPLTTKDIHVTPENVVELATLFRDCADRLKPAVLRIDRVLRLHEPWMKDPVSVWARVQFNQYFVDGANAFAKIVQTEYQQHKAMAVALVSTAEQYGLTEELTAAGFTTRGQR